MPDPFTGIRVVDCSLGFAGPRATGLLADYGADVVWVEPPGGDPFRDEHPAANSVFNRGKRSVTVDLQTEGGRQELLELLAGADVLVEAFAPEVAPDGLDFAQLHRRLPSLVVCSISGFGVDGPLAHLPAREGLVHAVLGTMADQAGHRDSPIYQGLPFAGIGAAYLAVIGIAGALLRREEDHQGRHVETSLYDGALAYMSMNWGETDLSVSQPPVNLRRTTAVTRMVTRSFECADGEYIGINTGALGAFGRLMKVLGLDDRIPPTDGVEMGVPLTAEEQSILEYEVPAVFEQHPRSYWVDVLLKADVCGIEHLRPTEAFESPQAINNALVATVDDPVLGRVRQVARPARVDGAGPFSPTPAPLPGSVAVESIGWSMSGLDTSGIPVDHRSLFAGIRVLDLGAYYAGPYSSRLLADLGADVIKVEPIHGDPLRSLEHVFASASAGKRTICANLKDPALRPLLDELLRWADVVHHNLRPGAAERLELDVDSVRKVNPEVVYLHAPGWGQTGPFALRQSFAPMMSGYVGATYEVAGQYNAPLPPVGNEDPGNGLLGAMGMLMALLRRRRTAETSYVENPQFNATMAHLSHVVRTEHGDVIGSGALDALQLGISATQRLLATADGWVCVDAVGDEEVIALGRALGIDLLADERFATQAGRRENDAALADLFVGAAGTVSTKDLMTAFEKEGVPAVEPVIERNMHVVLNDPEHRRSGRVAEVPHPTKGNVRGIGVLVRIGDTDPFPPGRVPELGEHTDEILTWAGYHDDQIAQLRERGVVR